MISLVVTTYNQAAYLREALDSVVSQQIDDLQVIVVDDGSTDGTLQIAREFEREGFEVLTKANGGPSSALNYGLSRAKGDFLVFLSGDDRLLADSIMQRVAILRSGGASIVSGLPEWIGKNSEVLPDFAHPPLFWQYVFENATDLFAHLYYKGNMICAPSVAMTRTCWNTVGHFNEDLWQLQDYEYWLRACAKDQAFHCVTDPCISYRWHGHNLSLANSQASEKEMDSVLLTAPDWLGKEKLVDLVWGECFQSLAEDLDPEILRVLIRMKHTRGNVRNGGVWQFRNMAKKDVQRDFLLNSLF